MRRLLSILLLLAPAAASAQDASLPTLTLGEAVEAVRRANPDLAAARARLLAADQTSRRAWAGYLPRVEVGGSYQRNSTSALLLFPDFSAGFEIVDGAFVPVKMNEIAIQQEDQWGAQLTVSQAIFAAPLIPAIRNAYTVEEIARLSTHQVEREMLFAASQAFYGAMGIKEAMGISRAQLELMREHERTANAGFRVGTAPELAVLRARIDVARAEQDLNRTENAYAAARGALAVLMGRSDIGFEVASLSQEPQDIEEQGRDLPGFDEMLERAYRERPDLRIAHLGAEAAERARWIVRGQFLPVIGAGWNWRYSDVAGFSGENTNWSLMVTASWSLYDGGLRYAQLHEANAQIQEASAGISSARNRIAQDVRQAALDIRSARANLVKAREQTRLARANWEAVEKAFQIGASSAVDVTDAATALRTAELAAVSEAISLRMADMRLQRAVGLPAPAGALAAAAAP